jgi:hypothetical protein
MIKFHAVGQDLYTEFYITVYIQAAIDAESKEKVSANGKVTLFSVPCPHGPPLCDERCRVDVVVSFLPLMYEGGIVVRDIFRGPVLLFVVSGLNGAISAQIADGGECRSCPGMGLTLGDFFLLYLRFLIPFCFFFSMAL